MSRGLGMAVFLTALLAAGPAHAGKRRAREAEEVGTLSQGGTRRGGLEFGIGAVLTATAGGLIGFGAQQFVRARQHALFCDGGGSSSGIDPCTFDPPPLGYASAGLSWGFSAALLVGGALLFARGARVRADARAHARLRVSVVPWWSGHLGGGASVGMRF